MFSVVVLCHQLDVDTVSNSPGVVADCILTVRGAGGEEMDV